MSSFNKVIMMGNLTRNPEFKQLGSGQGVCRLSIACNRQFKPKNATEAVQEVCFIDVDVWGVQAESCNKFLEKGSAILVDGRLKLDSWQDSEGQKRSKHSIVAERVTFIKSGASDSINNDIIPDYEAQETPKAYSATAKKPQSRSKLGEIKIKDEEPFDDLPF